MSTVQGQNPVPQCQLAVTTQWGPETVRCETQVLLQSRSNSQCMRSHARQEVQDQAGGTRLSAVTIVESPQILLCFHKGMQNQHQLKIWQM